MCPVNLTINWLLCFGRDKNTTLLMVRGVGKIQLASAGEQQMEWLDGEFEKLNGMSYSMEAAVNLECL